MLHIIKQHNQLIVMKIQQNVVRLIIKRSFDILH